MDCGDLSDPSNGQVTLTGTTFGSTATYECNTGFTLMGNMERTCQDDGNWSENEPTCVGRSCCPVLYFYSWYLEPTNPLSPAIDCGDLDEPSNGQVTLTGTTFGSMATYECDSGFTLVGNQVRTCQDDGNWSGTEPVCDGML